MVRPIAPSWHWPRMFPPVLPQFLLVLTLLLSACGDRPVEPAASRLDSTVRPGRILLWHAWHDPEAAVLQGLLAEFESVYPGMNVIARAFPARKLKAALLNAAAEGTSPDMILGEQVWIPELVEAGALRAIDPRGLAHLDLTPAALAPLYFAETLYAIPLSLQTLGLFANTERIPERFAEPARSLDDLLARADAGMAWGIHVGFDDAVWGVGSFGGRILDETGTLALDDGGFAGWLAWLQAAKGRAAAAGRPNHGGRWVGCLIPR
jgi:ABC-type glycerol-3-phosphate transport system substrate-binding protein